MAAQPTRGRTIGPRKQSARVAETQDRCLGGHWSAGQAVGGLGTSIVCWGGDVSCDATGKYGTPGLSSTKTMEPDLK